MNIHIYRKMTLAHKCTMLIIDKIFPCIVVDAVLSEVNYQYFITNIVIWNTLRFEGAPCVYSR